MRGEKGDRILISEEELWLSVSEGQGDPSQK
jgi:hypothetical protein